VLAVNTNSSALSAKTYAQAASKRQETSIERLSSGLRLNSAADDAAGLAVSHKVRSSLQGYKVALKNSADMISALQAAESGVDTIKAILLRLKELGVQAANGVYTAQDRENIELEKVQMFHQIELICSSTVFNGAKLLDGTFDTTAKTGTYAEENMRVFIDGLCTDKIGKGITGFKNVEESGPTSSLNISVATNNTSLANLEFFTNVAQQTIEYSGASVAPASGTVWMPTVDTTLAEFINKHPNGSYSIQNFSGTGTMALDNDLLIDSTTGKFTFVKSQLTAPDIGTYTMDVVYSTSEQSFTQSLTINYQKTNHVRDQVSTNTDLITSASMNLELNQGLNDLNVDLKTSEDFTYFKAFTDHHHSLSYDGGTYHAATYRINNVTLNGAAVANPFSIVNGVLTAANSDLSSGIYGFGIVAESGAPSDTHRFTQNIVLTVNSGMLNSATFINQSETTFALTNIESAIHDLGKQGARIGAYVNRLQTTIDKNLYATQGAAITLGRIIDADMAVESTNLSKSMILQNAATAVLSNSIQNKQLFLMLIE